MISENEAFNTRQAKIASALTACVAFGVYLYTLAPTVSGEDGGELVAAAYTLGIPHPTGYPIWTILGHLFTRIIPFGEIAWRVNLMSAFWAAATVGVLAYMLQRQSIRWFIACAAALSFAFSREFWEQSVIAEVYTLNAFFTITCVHLLLEWMKTRSTRTLYIFTILYSLSLANHSTMYLLGPFFLIYIFATHRPLVREYKTLATCTALFIVGLLVHLYLPIRSRANPAMDWGNPETFQGFWDVFTRRQYQGIMTNEHSFGLSFWQSIEFCRYLIWEFTPWVCALSLMGVAMMFERAKPALVLTTGIFIIVAVSSIIIPNFPIEHHSIWMNTTYWIPCWLMLAILIAFGLTNLLEMLPDNKWIKADAIFIIVISPLLTHFNHNDQSDYTYAHDYAQNQLDTMAENAIFFGSGDYTIFPLTYLHIVENQRPDITIANQYGYLSPSLYADMPDEIGANLPDYPGESRQPAIMEWIIANTDRPVYSTTPLPITTRNAVQRGLLYEYLADPRNPSAEDIWSTYTWHNSLDITKTHGDWTAELINYEYRIKRAQHEFTIGNADEATALLTEAQTLVHNDKKTLHNIALAFAKAGHLDEAVPVFKDALHDDPEYTPVLYNLANALLKQKHYTEAKFYSDKLLQQSPNSARFNRLNEKILRGL